MVAGQLAEPPGNGVERVEVGARLEGRVDRRVEGVHERVHVGGVEVVLLVPGGGREHDIRQQRGAGHPEVQRQQQVELAPRRLLAAPDDVARAPARGRLRRAQAVVRAEQVPQEVLVALGRGTEQVRPPQRQAARPVLRRVRVLDREPQRAVLQPAGHVGGDVAVPRLTGDLIGEVDRVAVELRVGRHPAQPGRERDRVHRVHARQVPPGQRGGERVGAVAVVAPLVGVGVPVRRADHLPRRALPVRRHRHGRPAGHRPALLLAHVMRPATPVAAHRPGEHEQRQHRAVGGVAVEPLADPRPHDDHGAALGLLGVRGHLPGDTHDLLGGHRGDRLLPGGGVGLGRVVVARGPRPGQPGAVHPVLGQHQVEHRRDEPARRRGAPARRGAAPRRCRRGRRSAAAAPRPTRRASRVSCGATSPSSRFHRPAPASV